jgi:hypothetical protein
MSPGAICYLFAVLSCFVVSVQAQQWDWIRRFSARSVSRSIAVDAQDSVYFAGHFSGTNYLGTNLFAVPETNGSFLVKLDPDGEIRWAETLHGSVSKMIVSPEGVAFVTGSFAVEATPEGQSSPQIIARFDDGSITWSDAVPGSHGYGLAFAPDGNIWVLGSSNRVFLRKYASDGTLLKGFDLGDNQFTPTGFAVNRDEQLFISGFTGGITFGTNTVGQWLYFVGRVDHEGNGMWAWTPGNYLYPGNEPNSINSIATTLEGNVVSIGTHSSGFRRGIVITTHSPDGDKLSTVQRWGMGVGSHKSWYFGANISVDVHGQLHTTGAGVAHYAYPTPSDGLWFGTFSNDVLVSETQISNTSYKNPWNAGQAIEATPDGAIYLSGTLTGYSIFGTNRLGGGDAFVARRSTLTPELNFQRNGDVLVISWPRAAFPFALQQSDVWGITGRMLTRFPTASAHAGRLYCLRRKRLVPFVCCARMKRRFVTHHTFNGMDSRFLPSLIIRPPSFCRWG